MSTETLARDYRSTAGNYLTASDLDHSDYWVQAQVNLAYVQRDGSLVPQPSLSGVFRVVDKQQAKSATTLRPCKPADNSPACGYLFSFTNGIYDSASRWLAIHIQGYGVSGADVSCKRLEGDILTCRWDPASGGAGGFDFVLKRAE